MISGAGPHLVVQGTIVAGQSPSSGTLWLGNTPGHFVVELSGSLLQQTPGNNNHMFDFYGHSVLLMRCGARIASLVHFYDTTVLNISDPCTVELGGHPFVAYGATLFVSPVSVLNITGSTLLACRLVLIAS